MGGGHYVVFINPRLDGKWFKFDDEVVSRCSKKDAINNNFGGNNSDELTFRLSTNAYMLVYVRDSHKHLALAEVTKQDDIPVLLQERLAEEKKLETMRKKERNEAHLYIQLNIILEREFYDHLGQSDLFDASKIEASKTLKVKKTSTMLEVTKQLLELLNKDSQNPLSSINSLRIWSIMSRYNNTTRPLNSIDLRESGSKTVFEMSKQDSAWLIFVEQANDLSFANDTPNPLNSSPFSFQKLMDSSIRGDQRAQLMLKGSASVVSSANQVQEEEEEEEEEESSGGLASPGPGGNKNQNLSDLKLAPFNSKEEVMIFFKFYDPKMSSLRYVFRLHLSITTSLNQLQERINKKMGFEANTRLLFFEEVRISQITPLTQYDIALEALAHEQLLDGDIYVFQVDTQNEKEYKFPTVTDYFRDLMHQAEVTFCDKSMINSNTTTNSNKDKDNKNYSSKDDEDSTSKDGCFTVTCSLKTKYDDFAKLVGDRINYDPEKLQFFRSNTYEPKTPVNQAIKYNPEFALKDAFQLNNNNNNNNNKQNQGGVKKIFYQKLSIRVVELEERRLFKCLWISSNLKVEKELSLMPLKKATVKDLLAECKAELLNEDLLKLTTNKNKDKGGEEAEEGKEKKEKTKEEKEEEAKHVKLRLVEIVASRLHRIIKEEMHIESLETQMANRVYRVEQVLADELPLNNNLVFNVSEGEEYLLPVAHFTKEIYATFGSPFLLKIRQGELFKEIKQRIQKKLDVLDKEFGSYRFALVSVGTANYIPDDDVKFDLSKLHGVQPWLGIDHTNKAANKNKGRFANMEKAIKIHN